MFEWLRERWDYFQTNYWSRWTPVERITFGAVAGVVGIVLLVLILTPALGVRTPAYATLATDLSPSDMQDIVSYLSRNGIDYRLTNNNTVVLVPQKDLYRARYDVGSGIVLTGGRRGFKLFEEPRLGITDQYFKEQQIHTREVELERTIRAGSPMIESVFVHLNIPEQRLFRKEERLPTATVKVITRGRLGPENVEAIQTLVAYAIDGLEPERVQVVDGSMRILSGVRERDPLTQLTDAQLQKTREFEQEREQKALEVLQRVAPRASVKVTAQLNFNHLDSTRTTFDPETVLRSERTETESSRDTPVGAVPGTAANVPGAAVTTGTGILTTREYEKTEINNEISSLIETRRVREFELKRMTVAVLVDGATDSLDALATLVKNAVGYDAERDGAEGFILASIPFDTSEEERMAHAVESRRRWDLMVAGAYAGIVLLVFLGMLGTVYYTYRKRAREHERMLAREMELLKEGELQPEGKEYSLAELGIADVGDISALPEAEQRRIKLRQKIEEFAKNQPKEFAQIIRTWLSE